MSFPGQVVPDRYTRKVCPCCGYDGTELQSDLSPQIYSCPSCHSDLYARPARSYAEMEGLFDDRRSITIDRLSRLLQTTPETPSQPQKRLTRGLALCMATVCMSTAMMTLLIAFVLGRI